MADFLIVQWKLRPQSVHVLYDRAHGQFSRCSPGVAHSLFKQLEFSQIQGTTERTLFTESDANGIRFRPDRPVLIVSSTSWTEDEDFSILLDAIAGCDSRMAAQHSSAEPRLVFVITGRGPLKAFFEAKISAMRFLHTRVHTVWLTHEQYPRLLGSADLGVCLHTSSSGLDLPMKVVDMFGSELPVCAINFSCLSELVHHGQNGLIFDTSQELCQQILNLCAGFPSSPKLQTLRTGTGEFKNVSWAASWSRVALPIFEQV